MSSRDSPEGFDIITHSDAALPPETLDQIHQWLHPTDYAAESSEYNRHIASQTPGTGLWVCDTQEYRTWHSSPLHGSLWIKGAPGAGKSVTAASIIQHLQSTEEHIPVLFFFFRNIIADNYKPRALIIDWLAQLLPHSARLQHPLHDQMTSRVAIDMISDRDLFRLFLDGVKDISRIYCVADALDEMTAESQPFLQRLNELATYRPDAVKLLLTSRPKQYLQSSLRDSSIVHISLQQKLVDADIVTYLTHRVHQPAFPGREGLSKQSLINMVAKRSDGLFLIAKLAMDQIESALASDSADLESLRSSLPVALEQMYANMLAKQRKEPGIDIALQVYVLQSVTHASRPLRLNELAALVRCIFSERYTGDAKAVKRLVATSCAPLVEVLEDETLQVVHHSLTEFLRGDNRSLSEASDSQDIPRFPIIEPVTAHKRLMLDCLTYLQSGSLLLDSERSGAALSDPSTTFSVPSHAFDFDESHFRREHLGIHEDEDQWDLKAARLSYPFLHYALDNWSYHASHCDTDDHEILDSLLRFCNPDSLTFRRWLACRWGSTTLTRHGAEGLPTLLHIASYAGLSQVTSKVLGMDASHAALDAQLRTALHWASEYGHLQVVSVLLSGGADPNPQDGRGSKPIHLATLRGHIEVVKLLLEAGVSPNTKKEKQDHAGRTLGGGAITKGECSIWYAARAGYEEILIAMIPYCNAQKVLEQLLCESCRFSRSEAVAAILNQSNVSPDAMHQGATALYWACRSADFESVRALLERGADVNKTSDWKPRRQRMGPSARITQKQTPLHRLIASWRGDHRSRHAAFASTLRILLQSKPDFDALDDSGTTPLFLAAAGVRGGDVDSGTTRDIILEALLDAGAEVNKVDQDGNSLMYAAFGDMNDSPNLPAVRTLIARGLDINLKDRDGNTPLHRTLQLLDSYSVHINAKKAGKQLIIDLLDMGADANCENNDGDTAIDLAMSAGSDLFRLLWSKARREETALERYWFRLLQNRQVEPFTEQLELLLDQGVDIETKDRVEGKTLFLHTVRDEHLQEVLRAHGANTRATDRLGNNALQCLARLSGSNPQQRRLQRFIDEGLDPLTRNHNGETLLHFFAAWYTGDARAVDYVRWLLKLGVSPNDTDRSGNTALHRYVHGPHMNNTVNQNRLTEFVQALNPSGGLDLGIKNNDGFAALHIAASKSDLDFAILLSAGAEVTTLTEGGHNVLHIACHARQPNIVAHVLGEYKAQVDVNFRDCHGRTPLHYGCNSGDLESVAYLLDHAAQIDATDSKGATPLHACAMFLPPSDTEDTPSAHYGLLRDTSGEHAWPGNPRGPAKFPKLSYRQDHSGEPSVDIPKKVLPSISTVVSMILDAGGNAAAVDEHGLTPLDVALRYGCGEFAKTCCDNEDYFMRATRPFDHEDGLNNHAVMTREELKRHIRASMPQPILLTESDAVDIIKKQPRDYLGMLLPEDVSTLVKHIMKTPDSPSSPSCTLLVELMKPLNLTAASCARQLIEQYSNYESLAKDTRNNAKSPYERHNKTPLRLACESADSNLQMLKLLVEEFHVDVNAHDAYRLNHRGEGDSGTIPGSTALHVLASADHYWQLRGLRYLLERGADANSLDAERRSPLHIASLGYSSERHGHKPLGCWRMQAVDILLDHGADPDLEDSHATTPVHAASNAPEILKLLIRRGANVHKAKNSPLFSVISEANLEALEILLDLGVSPDSLDIERHSRDVDYELTESRKVYALLCAACSGASVSNGNNSAPLVRTLVKRGADLYVPLNEQETMVHFLMEYGKHAVVAALLEESCHCHIDSSRRDQRGRTILMAACLGREALPGFSQRHWEPKVLAPPLCILDVFPGIDATAVDQDGKTALHLLLENTGMPDEIILQFINRKEVAPVLRVRDKSGHTPWHASLRILRPEICLALADKGVDILEPDSRGRTALHHIARQLLETCRDCASPGRLGIRLPGHYYKQCLDLWRWFLSQPGSSIHAADNEGNTPLHTFFLESHDGPTSNREEGAACHIDAFEALFAGDTSADILAVNNQGQTALHLICKRDDTEDHAKALFLHMMNKGLDPLKEDNEGRSVLDIASACDKDQIVGLLRHS